MKLTENGKEFYKYSIDILKLMEKALIILKKKKRTYRFNRMWI